MNHYLFVFLCCLGLIPGVDTQAQHTRSLDFSVPAEKSDSLFNIETGYPATGIVIKTDNDASFEGTYLVVNKDTLPVQSDEHRLADEVYLFSNLQTFSAPVSEFRFHPGGLTGDIQFIFIDARLPEKAASGRSGEKKKSCFLRRAFHDRSERVED